MSAQVYEVVTQSIIEKLEQGTAPWKHYASHGRGAPVNFNTKKAYRGINAFCLGMIGSSYSRPEWITFKQAQTLGGTVRKGEKSSPVMFCKSEKKPDGTKDFCIRYYRVFNVEQCDGLDLEPLPEVNEDLPPIVKAENIVNGMPQRPKIEHRTINTACYRPRTDDVLLPEEVSCSSEEYYSVVFHELAHSTGHEFRLNRETLKNIGSKHEYSKEELIAELTAAFLCAEAGILQKTLDNSAAYCKSWLKVLKNDRRFLVQAAGQAQKAADFILKKEIKS
jgi:antirestriction protein ArdC